MLGWNIGNDSVVHVTYADALAMPDRAPIAGSSAAGVIHTFANGYPEGSHALLAAVLAFSRDPLTTFNPVLAVMMALAAFPAYWLIRRQLASAPLAGIGAAAAAAGYLQFGFYSQGFMPQLAVTALLFGTLGLGYEALASASPVLAAMAGVTAAASVLVYSAAIGVYLAPAAALALVALVVMPGMPLRRRLTLPAVAIGAALITIAPELGRTLALARSTTSGEVTFTSDRGNLPNPVDPLTVLGAWIGPDYRTSATVPPTHLAMVAVVLLAMLAVLVALWRWRFALPAVLAVVASGAAYVASNAGIYYTAKTYQVAAFPIACAAVAGAGIMARAPWPRFAVPLALAGALLLGVAAIALKQGIDFAGRAAVVTPPEYRQLWALGGQTPRQLGLMLIRDDWAKALLPDAATPYDGTFGANVRPGARQVAGFIDIDSITPGSLGLVHWIVEPALGSVSTPPWPFRRSGRTVMAYRLWTRPPGSPPPASRTLPLEPEDTLGGIVLVPGRSVTAPATGSLEGRAVDGTLAFPAQWKLDGTAWGPWVALPDFVVPNPSGGPPARTDIEIGVGGLYRVSLIGQPTLNTRIRVDGATLPRPDPTAAGIYHFADLGDVRLAPGRHVLTLVAPGAGAVAYILAISLERVGSPTSVMLCVAGRGRVLGPGRPVDVRRGQQLDACGGKAALLDRIVQGPTSP